MKYLFFILLLPVHLLAQTGSPDLDRWQKQAKNVTIIRDHYGIPHIYGKTDADAVFGLMYAQCEDDFKRVEVNYLEKLGWLSRIKGESELYNDLLVRMIIDPNEAKADYARSPLWLKKLCDAWADAINYYVFKHAELDNHIGQYEPWFPFLWTDGSIGAINTAGMGAAQLKELYGGQPGNAGIGANGSNRFSINNEEFGEVLTGSNGFAFSPKITASKKSILYINPHVTFYFRPEVHMVSEEGLNVYGAVTWGQFFIYQGFNPYCGWMHTSSAVDAADAYTEKIIEKNGQPFYLFNNIQRPVKKKKIKIDYKTSSGEMQSKTFDVMFTHHGPVMGKRNGEYTSVRSDNRLASGLVQCWQRTKAKNLTDFKKTLDLKGNISNNTVYADAEGNIAYWHGNRIPKRDPAIDWSKPVDGTNPANEWIGYHPISETIYAINPPNGWLQNCNSTPFTVAGKDSPKKENYPAYMAPDGENFRGINAVRVLSEKNNYTIDKVIEAGYDRRLSLFEVLIPALIKAYEESNSKTDYSYLSMPILALKKWDYRCDTNSVATNLAVHFGEKLQRAVNMVKVPGIERPDIVDRVRQYASVAKPDELLNAFSDIIDTLKKKHGNWDISWGEINRFQRISGEIENKFEDSQPSIPVGFVSSAWGMLPSYSSRSFTGTTKRYGVNGNSFICAVEFGKKIKAKSLLAGGQSGNPNSPHFFDQGLMYSKGEFKDVLFYKEDILKHARKTYHPGH